MLILKKPDLLIWDNEVVKSSNVKFKLDSEFKDIAVLGFVKLSNGVVFSFPFEKEGQMFIGSFKISKEIIPFLKRSTVSLQLLNETFKKRTNEVEVVYDLVAIKNNVRKEVSEEVAELSAKISALENKLEGYAKRGVLKTLKVLNEKEIKEGMVPIATVDGNFTAAFPFADVVKTINGIDAVNESILLQLENIPFSENGKTSKEVVQSLLEATQTNAIALNLLLGTVKKLVAELEKIKLELAEQKNTALF